MVEQQKRTNDILMQLFNRPAMVENIQGNDLGNHFPNTSQAHESIAAPSKMELAIDWLRNNQVDLKLTGRDLESLRRPMDVKISYRTWNDAKKFLDSSSNAVQ